MRKERSLGILFPPILFSLGIYLLHESIARSEWYMDIFLMFGAIISAVGLVTVYWAIQQQRSIRRLQQHVRRHQ
jgi:NhaP-type Na+/H+ or K+/H+ antiporter